MAGPSASRTRRIPVIVAPIQTWRAFVLGDGRLKKEVAKTRAVQTVTRLGWKHATPSP